MLLRLEVLELEVVLRTLEVELVWDPCDGLELPDEAGEDVARLLELIVEAARVPFFI